MQLSTLREFIKNVMDNTVAVTSGIDDIITGKDHSLSHQERIRLTNGYIWYDFASIPQCDNELNHEQTKQAQMDAIQSIPAYVKACSFFIVLCPTIPHTTGGICDFRSWQQRGWCRAEGVSWLLGKDQTEVLIVRSPTEAHFASNRICAVQHPVGQGEFAVAEDRKILYQVLETLLDHSLAKRDIKSERDPIGLFLKCIRHTILAGLPQPTPTGASQCSWFPSQDEQEAFLSDFGFTSWHHRRAHGWTPLMCAAAEDNAGMVRAALAAGLSPHQKTKVGVPLFFVASGLSALHLACLWSSEATVQALLDGKADPNQLGSFAGVTPLVATSTREDTDPSALGIARTLIKHGAKVAEGQGPLGLTPLHTASHQGNLLMVQEMIQQGGDVHRSLGFLGFKPLHMAAQEDNVTVVQFLLDCRSDPNCVAVQSGIARALVLGGRCAAMVGATSKPLKYFAEASKSTPLHFAADGGHVGCFRALLDAHADPTLRNSMQQTPLDLACSKGHEGVKTIVRSMTILRSSLPADVAEEDIFSI